MDVAMIVGVPGEKLKKKGAGLGAHFLEEQQQVYCPYFAGFKSRPAHGETLILYKETSINHITHTPLTPLTMHQSIIVICNTFARDIF